MATLNRFNKYGGSLISFGKEPVSESKIVVAEKLRVKSILIKSNATSFNQLHLNYYYSKGFNFYVEKITPVVCFRENQDSFFTYILFTFLTT